MVITLCILSNESNQTDQLLRSMESLLYKSYYSGKTLNTNESLAFLKKLIILKQAKSCYKIDNKFTGWGMFVIEKKFLISFLGAVTPFSIMLIQLQQNCTFINHTRID